jgi:hypothetical protein
LKHKVEIDKAIRNAPAEKTIIQVGRPAIVPNTGGNQRNEPVNEPAVANGITPARPNLSLVSKLFGRKD